MSSMRNAAPRRNHRERAQPQERSKWGLLEKHKDYSLRAADHNQKKRKLHSLRQKAAERNEDEFYFGMLSSKSGQGVKRGKRGAENGGGGVLGVETVKLMKSQDAGYLRTVLQSTRHDRERLEQEVVMGETGVKTDAPQTVAREGRLVFGEDGKDLLPVPQTTAGEDLDTDEELSPGNDAISPPLTREQVQYGRRKRHALDVKRQQLEVLQDREKQLSTALREVEDQRARMNGTVSGVNKQGVKFKVRQRKP